MLWQTAIMIAFACLICGFFGTLGYLAALVAAPCMMFFAAMGGFYDDMDTAGWAMLIGPPVAALAGATGAKLWRRRHPPEPDFVPPPPPPGWQKQRRQRFGKRSSERFKL